MKRNNKSMLTVLSFFFPRSRLRDTAACTVNINIYTELLDV